MLDVEILRDDSLQSHPSTIYEKVIEEIVFTYWPELLSRKYSNKNDLDIFRTRYDLIEELLALRLNKTEENNFKSIFNSLNLPVDYDKSYILSILKNLIKIRPYSIELTFFNDFAIESYKKNPPSDPTDDEIILSFYNRIPTKGINLANLKNNTEITKGDKILCDRIVKKGIDMGVFFLLKQKNFTSRKTYSITNIYNEKGAKKINESIEDIKPLALEERKEIENSPNDMINLAKFIYLNLDIKKYRSKPIRFTKIKNWFFFRKVKSKILLDILQLGEKLGYFKIKEIPFGAKDTIIIKKNLNKSAEEKIRLIQNQIDEKKINNTNNYNKIRYENDKKIIKILNKLKIFLVEPRSDKEINDLVNNDVNYNEITNVEFDIEKKDYTFTDIDGRLKLLLKLIANKSINSKIYLRRDIIFKKSDELGFFCPFENALFHFSIPLSASFEENQKRYKKNHKYYTIIEYLSHIFKYGMSLNLLEIFRSMLTTKKYKLSDKEVTKNLLNYNLINFQMIKNDLNSYYLITSKFKVISNKQINLRNKFWFSKYETKKRFIRYISNKILDGGVKRITFIPTKYRKFLFDVSYEYKILRYNMTDKKRPIIQDYSQISKQYACLHVSMGQLSIFFDRNISYDIVEDEFREFLEYKFSRARQGQINGPLSFERLIEYWKESGIDVIYSAFTHGKNLSQWGGLKFLVQKTVKNSKKPYTSTVEVEFDGYTISRRKDGLLYLSLIQHKHGTYKKGDCIDSVRVITIKENKKKLEYYRHLKGFHLLKRINQFEVVYLVNNNLGFKESTNILKKNNFREIDYNTIGYEPIDETDYDYSIKSNLRSKLTQTFNNPDFLVNDYRKIFDKLDKDNIIEFKMNGICAGISIESDGKILISLKNSDTEIILPPNYEKAFKLYKNCSFKLEIIFKDNNTFQKYQSMTRDHNVDFSILKENIFIVITDIFKFNGENVDLENSSSRRRILEETFLIVSNGNDLRKYYDQDFVNYLKFCGRNQILCIAPGIKFSNTKEGIKNLTDFIEKYKSLVISEEVGSSENFYHNIDGFIIKKDSYNLFNTAISRYEAIKIKTFETFSLRLWAVIKQDHSSSDLGLLVALKSSGNPKFFPIQITQIPKGIARKAKWQILSKEIIYECAFPKGLYKNTISNVKRYGLRPNANIDNINKILRHYKIPPEAIKLFHNILEGKI
ncbi:MAG: hypothetical protein EAX96_06625 [Candidatus Lokiarchaeota archaeon]|nr:hypothetical protein [Candidatus Lokiarchaeota archaeon]